MILKKTYMKVLMYARILLILGILFNFSISVSFSQALEYLKKGVVRIQAETYEGVWRMGTGFIIQQNDESLYILTVSHLVEDSREINVEFYALRNQITPAEVIRIERDNPAGLALLKVSERIPSHISVLRLGNSLSLHEKDSVTIVGFPSISGVEWAVITGNLVGRIAREITFSGAVEKGYSGAPLIRNGMVIGIVTQGKGKLAYATPALIAEYVLESWGIYQETKEESPRSNLLLNGDFTTHWSSGWKQYISPGDQERGAVVAINVENQQLRFQGDCNFCAIAQSTPIDHLRGLKLQVSFQAKACLSSREGECRRGSQGIRHMNNYDVAGIQIEYQDEHEEPLGILRYMNTSAGYVVANGLFGMQNASVSGEIMSKSLRIDDAWQTLELDLYKELITTFSFAPDQIKTILVAFFNSSQTENGEGFGDITVDSVKLYYE